MMSQTILDLKNYQFAYFVYLLIYVIYVVITHIFPPETLVHGIRILSTVNLRIALHLSSAICGQCSSRMRSACASAQSDLRATMSAEKSLKPYSTDKLRGDAALSGATLSAHGILLGALKCRIVCTFHTRSA